MSTYREIVGKKIKKVSSDPSDGLDGQMWYNSTTGSLRGLAILEAWTSTSPTIVARDKAGAAGTQTALLAIGGDTALTSVDEYNGTGWKSAPAINTGRHGMASGGTTSAAWKAGGSPPTTTTATEEYNSSSWTTVPGTLNTGRYILGSCGTQTAGLCNGGYDGSTNVNNSEEYNGTSWSNGNAMNTARRTPTDIGVQTAAVSFGGQPPPGPVSNDVEEYDGTSWTTVGNYPTNIADSAGSGTLTAGLAFGGNVPPSTTATKKYDGTSWTSAPSLGTAAKRSGGTPAGSNAAAVNFGGDAPGSHVTTAEEFNSSTNTITAAAWASGGVLPAAWYGVGSSTNGTQDSAILFAGNNPGAFTGNTSSFEYNGSSWSADPSMSTARAYLCGFGTATAGVGAGGLVPPGATGSNAVEEYTTSWTTGNTIPQAGWNQGACGTL